MSELPQGVDRLSSGRYRARVAWGGRRVTRTFATAPAAVRWRLDALDALRAGKDAPGAPVAPPRLETPATVLDVVRALGRGIEAGTVRNRNGRRYKPSVSRRMESSLRQHVIPRVGSVSVVTLTRRDVQRMVDELAAATSGETARKALNALSVALRVAERDGVIDRNPVYDISVPRGDVERAIRVITPEESDALLAAARADDERLKRSLAAPLLTLALGAGLRSGEVLALRWGQDGLDLDREVVHVRGSVDRVRAEDGRFPIVAPKSLAAVRSVPLDPGDVPTLRRHLLATGRPADGALVFPDPQGAPLDAISTLRHIWARVTEAAGVTTPAPRLHDARHAWAIAMLRAGVAPPALAKLGGWSDVGIIHRRYGRHALPDELETAGQALGEWRAARREMVT